MSPYGGRRKIDWIQFGILLLSVLTLLCTTLIEHGRTAQKLDDHGESIKELRQDIKDIDKKLDERADALDQKIQKLREENAQK